MRPSHAIITLLLLILMTACASRRPDVITMRQDSIRSASLILAGSRQTADTTVIRDSVIIDRTRDTITRTIIRWRERVSARTDTLRIVARDTVRIRTPVPVPAPSGSRAGEPVSLPLSLLIFLLLSVLTVALILRLRKK